MCYLAQTQRTIYKMSFRPLSPELQIIAEEELNEVPSQIPENLQIIRQWLAEQPHLKMRTDDQWLLSFLRGCKFNLEKTKAKLDVFYTMRTYAPDFFGGRDPFTPSIQELLEFGTCIPLSKPSDPAAPITVLIRHKSVDAKKIPFSDVMKVISMTLDILIQEDDNFIVAGIVGIDDASGCPFSHYLQVPSLARKLITCFLGGYPLRLKELHILNLSTATEGAFKAVRFFMPEKIKGRISVHSQNHTRELMQFVPPEILPAEYGGTAGPIAVMAADWKKKVESFSNWFLEDAEYGCDESKRPKVHRTCELS